MSDEKHEALDDERLLAYREGLLNEADRRIVEEHLKNSSDDRNRLEGFDRDLEFMRRALVSGGEAQAKVVSIQRRIAERSARRWATRSLAAAAILFVLASAVVAYRGSGAAPRKAAPASEGADPEYLFAAAAQLEYEVGLLFERSMRAQRRDTRTPIARPYQSDASAVLLESARYWETSGGKPALSQARHREILEYFPGSAAALAVQREKPSSNP